MEGHSKVFIGACLAKDSAAEVRRSVHDATPCKCLQLKELELLQKVAASTACALSETPRHEIWKERMEAKAISGSCAKQRQT